MHFTEAAEASRLRPRSPLPDPRPGTSSGVTDDDLVAPRILGQVLVRRGVLSASSLEEALADQARTPRRLGEILLERRAVDEEQLARGLAEQLGLSFLPTPLKPSPSAPELLDGSRARQLMVLPVEGGGRHVALAMADPLDLSTVEDLRFRIGRRVDAFVATPTAIVEGIERAYGAEWSELLSHLPTEHSRESESAVSLERAAQAAPVVKLVERILRSAVDGRASDIHIEPTGTSLLVRHRVDGVLRTFMEIPGSAWPAVLSRIKIVSGMDIAVKRRPQDGGLTLRHRHSDLTLRCSTLPTGSGEKAVIRILDPRKAPSGLNDLGMGPDDVTRLRAMLGTGQGVILSAGPTGSGKSSTLYAALRELDRVQRNVITLEDPIEYRLEGLSQVQVEPKAGLTFPAALRSVLRQDPDVIMVGEIRDAETAEIAMAAAVTGHLVLSTIHTVDAPGAISRLLDMGVPPFLVAGGLAGVVAQRLVRTVCARCRGRSAEGCDHCEDGFRGRTGVFQVLRSTEPLQREVMGRASTSELRRLATRDGMGSLAADARRKVAEGVTTPHEVARVIVGEPGAGAPCEHCGGHLPSDSKGCPHCGQPRGRWCRCGSRLRSGWRYCPACLRRQ